MQPRLPIWIPSASVSSTMPLCRCGCRTVRRDKGITRCKRGHFARWPYARLLT